MDLMQLAKQTLYPATGHEVIYVPKGQKVAESQVPHYKDFYNKSIPQQSSGGKK